ncbi:MAG: ATP-binding protein [Cognatishimia sp.]
MTAPGSQLFVPKHQRSIPKRLALGLFSALIVFLSYQLALLFSKDPATPIWAAGGIVVAMAITASLKVFRKSATQRVTETVALAIAHDKSPRLIASSTGAILHKNPAVYDAMMLGETITEVMNGQMLDSENLINRLQEAAGFDGHISERILTRLGSFVLDVAQLEQGLFLWSITPRNGTDSHSESGPIIPMLTAASSGTILFMNAAARTFLGERKTKLSDVFEKDILNASDMNVVHTSTGISNCFIMEKALSGGRREIYIVPAQDHEIPNTGLSFEDLPVPILKTNVNGDILMVNSLARHLLGETLAQAHHLSDVMEGLGRPLRDWLTEAAAGRAQSLTEFLRLKRDDREAYMQVTLGRLSDGQETALFAVINDATELKTLEAQFVQSQKMQAIGQLAGGVAHDFNNLLTAISGHCDLLLLRHDEDDPDYADLTQINQNANRAAALVGQLLAYSRKQTLRPVTLDLRDSLSNLSRLLNRLVGEKIRLKVQHEPNLKPINVDRQQFEQVMMNLVVNARDAMPDGGDIEITSENLCLSAPLSRDNAVVPCGDYVSVCVIDHGTGISDDKKSKVFEPFYTTKRTGEGTGLGLSTAYGIVKQSGGFIFLDSVVGQGTTFRLYFPASDSKAEATQNAPKPIKETTPPQEGVVLLVEDEAPVRAFASRALRLKGLTVLEADCAENALTMLEDPSLNIDLFVSDVIMPGMDGPTWVKQAREIRPDTRVIFMSGYAEESFAEINGTLDNSMFLPKPFSLAELSTAVEQQIAQSRDALV